MIVVCLWANALFFGLSKFRWIPDPNGIRHRLCRQDTGALEGPVNGLEERHYGIL